MQSPKHFFFSLIAFLMVNPTVIAQSKFELPKLSYTYSELEPYIDAQTMEIHYSKHHQAYVNNLNKALEANKVSETNIENILKNISNYKEAIRNNGGGHYNHSLFWAILTPKKNTALSKRFSEAITKEFGSIDSLKILMNNAASTRFGSGWAWLSVDNNKKLFVSSTANQDNPLMNIVEKQGTPILGIDVWEHAYYLKYQNKRTDYLTAIWNVINWDEVSKRYEAIVPKGKFDDWPQIKEYHKVMSQTFHPSEEGNLEPIKTRSGELAQKAITLAVAPIPAEFDKPEIKKAVKQLLSNSKKLDEMVKKKTSSDSTISKALTNLHEIFHRIVGLCEHENQD
jgi:superoxide dismutase